MDQRCLLRVSVITQRLFLWKNSTEQVGYSVDRQEHERHFIQEGK
jgi:hypothetical protein